jgi:putative spermidine/putrescine transport system permease protein
MNVRRLDRIGLLIVPALAYLALIYALPLVMLLAKSLRDADGALSLAAYGDFLTDPFQLQVLWRTLRVSFLVTVLALAIAWPTAIAMTRARGGWLTMFMVAMVLPLSLGVVVKAFAWSILFRSNGIVNQTMQFLGIIDEPVRMLFTETALVIGAANVFLPLMVLPIYSVLSQQDASLPDAAASLGAGPYYRFFHVILPLSMPGVVAGSAFVFSMAISMYVIPSLIVGDTQQTVAMMIARSFLYLRNETLGSSLSAILLLIAITVVLGSSWLAAKLGART